MFYIFNLYIDKKTANLRLSKKYFRRSGKKMTVTNKILIIKIANQGVV